jgi:hypothetical protein
VLKRPPNFNSFFDYELPRKGNWAFNTEMEVFSGGLAGNDKVGYYLEVEPTYFVSDAFNLYVRMSASRTPDWLIWQRDNLIGSFDGRDASVSAGFNWTIGNRQELRLKLQAIGIDARLRQAYRVETGNAVATAEPVDDLSVRTFAFQLRYRYELAPLSYLYVVYGRGGYDQDVEPDSSARLIRDSFSLRDDEQLLVKLSYRFE